MSSALPSIGGWQPTTEAPRFAGAALAEAARQFRQTAFVLQDPQTGAVGVSHKAKGWGCLIAMRFHDCG